MSTSINFGITAQEIDSSNNNIYNKPPILGTYIYINKSEEILSLATSESYITLTLGTVTTCKALKLTSDQLLSIKLNGSTTAIDNISILVFFGDITQIQVKNNSGSTATISYDLYGI